MSTITSLKLQNGIPRTQTTNITSGGGGSKNYLSAITTSNGTNTGNGDFELGNTTGWSLAHVAFNTTNGYFLPTGVATAGSAFSSTSGGTAANANLSLGVVSSGQLDGSYSGSLASSAASVQGDLLITNAFNIDNSDKAQAIQVTFNYSVFSGASGLNFSGTSSNSFAVWLYDVTNAAWIMPAGVYDLVQTSGTGTCSATFQTTTNSTQYQLALININASTAAYTLYLDSFVVGPNSYSVGPAMSDWVAYSPVIGGQTTAPTPGTSTTYAYWRRVGDSMEIKYDFIQTTAGSAGSGTYLFPIPSGYTIDATKINVNTNGINGVVGSSSVSNSNYSAAGFAAVARSTDLIIAVYNTNTSNVSVSYIGSTDWPLSVATTNYSFTAKVPIAGWSSNVLMSNDSNTGPVVASAGNSNYAATSGQPIPFGGISIDNTASITLATGRFTAPVTGNYTVSASGSHSTAGNSLNIFKNGSLYGTAFSFAVANGGTAGTIIIPMNAGDYIDGRVDGSFTLNSYSMYVSKIGTTQQIAQIDSVNARYISTAGGAINSSATLQSFATIDYDSHGAWTGSQYNVPVSGKYTIRAQIITAPSVQVVGGNVQLILYKNGVGFSMLDLTQTEITSSVVWRVHGEDTINCLAGDYLQIYALANNATTQSTNSGWNYVTIERVGN